MELTFPICGKLGTLCNYLDKAELPPPVIEQFSITILVKRMFTKKGKARLEKRANTCLPRPLALASTMYRAADLTERGNNIYQHVREMLKVAQIEVLTPRATLHRDPCDWEGYKPSLQISIRLHPGANPITLKFEEPPTV
jgi:hypothetical protein